MTDKIEALREKVKPIAWMNQHGAVTRFGHEKWVLAGHTVDALYSEADYLAVLSELDRLRSENGALIDENTDLRNEPWPEWASSVLKVIRGHSGYDGYDDAIDGIDLPSELDECLSELADEAGRVRARAEKAEAELSRLRSSNEATNRDELLAKAASVICAETCGYDLSGAACRSREAAQALYRAGLLRAALSLQEEEAR